MKGHEYLGDKAIKKSVCKDGSSFPLKHSFNNLLKFDFMNVKVLSTVSNLFKRLFIEMAHTEKNK